MSIKNKHREKNEYKVFGEMEAGHLMEDAEKWWDRAGRDLCRKRTFSNDSKEQQNALDATNPIHPNYIGGKSGILLGLAWVMLTPVERRRIMFTYTLTLKETTDK